MIQKLPDTATLEDIMYELYVLEVIQHGLADADAGRTVSHEEAKKRMQKWLSV